MDALDKALRRGAKKKEKETKKTYWIATVTFRVYYFSQFIHATALRCYLLNLPTHYNRESIFQFSNLNRFKEEKDAAQGYELRYYLIY